jgi:hypothetical protein
MADDLMSSFRSIALRPNELVAAGPQSFLAAHLAEPAAVEALADAVRRFDRARFKPLPPPPGAPPFRMNLRDVVGSAVMEQITQRGKLVFHTVGDTGQHGHGAAAQESVSFHMERQIKGANVPEADKPCLYYHLGDVIYFNGELRMYPEQFYEPYQFYPAPIVAIPGNHDGENVRGETSLGAFVSNFCTTTPHIPPMPGQSRRRTMTQPHVFFTLNAPFVTIIGLYSNVTGDLDDPNGAATPQLDWLKGELQAADPGKFLIVAVHHPPFSLDNTHGGERKIGLALDEAFASAGRLPHLVLTAHVHDYQRFSRRQSVGATSRTIPYLVAGAGGYAGYEGLHKVFPNTPLPDDVELLASNDALPGFLRLTVTPTNLVSEYFVVPKPPNHVSANVPATLVDSVSVAL